MKNINVIKKSEAMKMAKEHEGFCSIKKYCDANYIWHGSENAYVGRTQQVPDRVLALWVERRTDSDGPYAIFRCLINNN